MIGMVKSTLSAVIDNRQQPNQPAEFERKMPFSLPAEDNRLTEGRIIRSLYEADYLQLRDVQVCADDGSIVLRGKVSSYYLKQLSQSIAMAIAERYKLRNELDVVALGRSHIAGATK